MPGVQRAHAAHDPAETKDVQHLPCRDEQRLLVLEALADRLRGLCFVGTGRRSTEDGDTRSPPDRRGGVLGPDAQSSRTGQRTAVRPVVGQSLAAGADDGKNHRPALSRLFDRSIIQIIIMIKMIVMLVMIILIMIMIMIIIITMIIMIMIIGKS